MNINLLRQWHGATSKFICMDAADYMSIIPSGARPFFIVDPPWDAGLWSIARNERCKLVFFDGGACSEAISHHGAPSWLFAWDCVSSWWTPNRPLRRAKLCAFYGDIEKYNQDGAFTSYRDAKSRVVRNTRGEYVHHPADGVRLSDVYQRPITELHKSGEVYKHAKPTEWLAAMIANCIGDCNLVIDLFCGSGAAGYAANLAGIDYIGLDIDLSNVGMFDNSMQCKMKQGDLWA